MSGGLRKKGERHSEKGKSIYDQFKVCRICERAFPKHVVGNYCPCCGNRLAFTKQNRAMKGVKRY